MLSEELRKRALDLAMEGLTEAVAMDTLRKEFKARGGATHAALAVAIRYAYHGEGSKTPVRHDEAQKVADYCKRKARKAKVMLSVNYDRHDLQTSLADAIADLLHLCEREGLDFEEAWERGRGHFNAELVGGEHGEF